MNYFLAFGIALLLTSCTSAPQRKDWESCQSDSDCIVVKGPCYMPKAIHKEATNAFDVYKERVEQTQSCAIDGRLKWSEEITPRCIQGRCNSVYSRKVNSYE